jgi:hypothetical protein
MTTIHRKALFLIAGLAILTAGVALPSTAKAQTIVVSTADYQPLFYNGCLVFFDDWGRPFINVDDQVVFIPTTYVYYTTYVRHFQMHRARYHAWYRTHGVRLRGHRSPINHRPAVRTRVPNRRRPAVTPRTPQSRRSWVTTRAPSRRQPSVASRVSPSRRPAVTRRAPARSSRGSAARSTSSRRRR